MVALRLILAAIVRRSSDPKLWDERVRKSGSFRSTGRMHFHWITVQESLAKSFLKAGAADQVCKCPY